MNFIYQPRWPYTLKSNIVEYVTQATSALWSRSVRVTGLESDFNIMCKLRSNKWKHGETTCCFKLISKCFKMRLCTKYHHLFPYVVLTILSVTTQRLSWSFLKTTDIVNAVWVGYGLGLECVCVYTYVPSWLGITAEVIEIKKVLLSCNSKGTKKDSSMAVSR